MFIRGAALKPYRHCPHRPGRPLSPPFCSLEFPPQVKFKRQEAPEEAPPPPPPPPYERVPAHPPLAWEPRRLGGVALHLASADEGPAPAAASGPDGLPVTFAPQDNEGGSGTGEGGDGEGGGGTGEGGDGEGGGGTGEGGESKGGGGTG